MKTGLLVMLTLGLGALVTHFLIQDNGYVLINFRGYAVEMSVPILVFLLIALYLAARLLIRIWHAPREIGEAAARNRARRANKLMTRGYIELAEGNFARGEKLLTRGVRKSETPLLNYLAAARAAQMQGNRVRRDNWLKMAYEQEPRAANAVLLTQAELQLGNGEAEAARATLEKVLEQAPRNPEALKLMAELCRAEGDWQGLADLLPKLRKRPQVPVAVLDDWTVESAVHLLETTTGDAEKTTAIWKSVPRHLRNDPRLLRNRITAAVAAGRTDEAERMIRKAITQAWDTELVLAYGALETEDPGVHLKRAEAWLHDRPEDPDLLLTAGRLCVRNKLWGKARSYLESSLAIRPSPETYHELGQLMLMVGEQESASEAFQRGLTLRYAGTEVPRLERTSPAEK